MDLGGVAEEIQHRVIHIFSRDMGGRRATNGGNSKMNRDPHFRDYVLFHEVRTHCGVKDAITHASCFCSSSMEMMGEALERPTKRDGESSRREREP